MGKFLGSGGTQRLWNKLKAWVQAYVTLANNDGVYKIKVGDSEKTIPNASSTTPKMDGTAAVGSEASFAKGDHVHPTDTSRAPTSHASTGTTYGKGTSSNYGHVKLSDSTSSTSSASDGVAASPKAVKAAYDLAQSALDAVDDIDDVPYFEYRGELDDLSGLPGSSGASIGDVYWLRNENRSVYARKVTQNSSLYWNETRHNQNLIIDTSNASTPIIQESAFRTNLANTSQDKFSAYPQLAYTYVDPSVRLTWGTGESNFRVVPVMSSTYGTMLVLVAYEHSKISGGAKKAWAMTTRYDGPMNSWSGHIENMGEVVEITSETPASADIRGFTTFGGGVEWQYFDQKSSELSEAVSELASAQAAQARIFNGTCATSAGTTAKVVACPKFAASDLVKGALIFVTFDATNSGAVGSLTMNVNGTGAKPIKKHTNASVGNLSAAGELRANQTYLFSYDGTNWVCLTLDYNTTYTLPSAMTQEEANAGTSETGRTISAKVLGDTISAKMQAVAGALVYKGTLTSESQLLGTALSKGWYYIVAMPNGETTSVTVGGEACEAGDMIIVNTAGTYPNTTAGKASLAAALDIIQSNIAELTDDEIDAICV